MFKTYNVLTTYTTALEHINLRRELETSSNTLIRVLVISQWKPENLFRRIKATFGNVRKWSRKRYIDTLKKQKNTKKPSINAKWNITLDR